MSGNDNDSAVWKERKGDRGGGPAVNYQKSVKIMPHMAYSDLLLFEML